MFSKSLKKQQKLRLLLDLLGPVSVERCLLVTNGDNNGALNYHFRAHGGSWEWVELEHDNIAELSAFLGEPVHHAALDAFPFDEGRFDRIVVIDAHEHLTAVDSFNRELARILRPGGILIVTTPNGNPWLPVALLKRVVGMGPASYGHVVQGYRVGELEAMAKAVGLEPTAWGGYARFFTESAELAINFGYVKILSRRKKGPRVAAGTIAPTSEEQLKSVEKTFRLYSMIYPVIKTFAAFDAVVPGRGGYAVAVAARKPA
jgi:SAM-dependent methyltransferase